MKTEGKRAKETQRQTYKDSVGVTASLGGRGHVSDLTETDAVGLHLH